MFSSCSYGCNLSDKVAYETKIVKDGNHTQQKGLQVKKRYRHSL